MSIKNTTGAVHKGGTITVMSNRSEVNIDRGRILYVEMRRNVAEIHMSDGTVIPTRNTMEKLCDELGDDFVKVHRSLLVAVMAVHSVDDYLVLINGEKLDYVKRKRKQIKDEIEHRQKDKIVGFSKNECPHSYEEYREYYRGFEHMPFAFADIEMVFDEESHAVDWIFRYGNEALGKIEKYPLNELINSSFSSIFPNMDSKWLRNYERSAIFGDRIETMDYSPEVDTNLQIISFPTFEGHCGCILFDIDELKYVKGSALDVCKNFLN